MSIAIQGIGMYSTLLLKQIIMIKYLHQISLNELFVIRLVLVIVLQVKNIGFLSYHIKFSHEFENFTKMSFLFSQTFTNHTILRL